MSKPPPIASTYPYAAESRKGRDGCHTTDDVMDVTSIGSTAEDSDRVCRDVDADRGAGRRHERAAVVGEHHLQPSVGDVDHDVRGRPDEHDVCDRARDQAVV